MRKTNGHKEHSNFDEFWDEINKLFEEYQTVVHERRYGTFHYLPFAISVREQIEQVKQRRSDITMPSEDGIQLQFTPKIPIQHEHLDTQDKFQLNIQYSTSK